MARQTDKVSYRADSRRKWKKRDIINIKSRNFYIFIQINVFCSLTLRPTDKRFIEQMLINQSKLYKKESQLYLK